MKKNRKCKPPKVGPMRPHELRVVQESNELKIRRQALLAFIIGSPTFYTLSQAEQDRLRDQYAVMLKYGAILQERIDNFPPAPVTVRQIMAEENLPEIPKDGPAIEGLAIANVTKIETVPVVYPCQEMTHDGEPCARAVGHGSTHSDIGPFRNNREPRPL